MRHRQSIFLIMLVCAAAAVLLWFGASADDEPDYSSFSTRPMGVSLLYDTLRKMQFPVAQGYMPVDERCGINDVYIIIRPDNPAPNDEITASLLDWVRKGGRLIFLDNSYPTAMDMVLLGYAYTEAGNLTHYSAGLGEVITGCADDVVNQSLMYDGFYGSLLQSALSVWDADHVYFAEFYHGYRTSDNFFARLPSVVKLAVYQLIIIMAGVAWHLGKRFGKPVPFYEEAERDENEQVHALARLYYRTRADKK